MAPPVTARNTNRLGANFELDVMHYLAGCDCETTYARPRHIGWKGFGYDVLRSSGSRGKVDVVAIGPRPVGSHDLEVKYTHPFPLFIQVKLTNPLISPAERIGIQDLALRAGAVPLVGYRAKDKTTGRLRPHFRQLTGPGPKEWVAWEPEEDD